MVTATNKPLEELTDEDLLRLYKGAAVADENVWSVLLLRHENCVFKLMRQSDVKVQDFRMHPLYAFLVDGVRYAMNNYTLPENQNGVRKKTTFFTFLHSTLKNIFIRRFYSNEKFHQSLNRLSVNDGEGDVLVAVSPLDNHIEEKPRLFNSLDGADKIDKEFQGNFIAGCVMKLHYGVDCRSPYKAAQLQRIIPEYIKLKASGFSLPSTVKEQVTD